MKVFEKLGISKKELFRLGIDYVMKCYINVEDFLEDLNERDYFDVYLLKVHIPKMNGLEVARKIRNEFRESIIRYITNYVEYAIEAFEVNAYRYIPKAHISI